jgi:hypothetical protein
MVLVLYANIDALHVIIVCHYCEPFTLVSSRAGERAVEAFQAAFLYIRDGHTAGEQERSGTERETCAGMEDVSTGNT